MAIRLPAVFELVPHSMRFFALLLFLALGGCYVWSVPRALPQDTPAKKPDLSAEELARAKTLFKEKCSRCHGVDGRGQTVLGHMLEVPDFTSEKWWQAHRDDDLIRFITNGDGDMPSFAKKLTKPEISLLANYVRHFNKSEH